MVLTLASVVEDRRCLLCVGYMLFFLFFLLLPDDSFDV